jgi:hypothetical protein
VDAAPPRTFFLAGVPDITNSLLLYVSKPDLQPMGVRIFPPFAFQTCSLFAHSRLPESLR